MTRTEFLVIVETTQPVKKSDIRKLGASLGMIMTEVVTRVLDPDAKIEVSLAKSLGKVN